MQEKIEQLCEQIKDLLKKNDREYIIVGIPEESYSFPRFTFPEYMMSVVRQGVNSSYSPNNELRGDVYDSCESLGIDCQVFILDEYDEPVCVGDCDDEDDEEDMYYESTQYELLGVRIESDNLLFCVQEAFTDDEQTACENAEEVSLSSMVDSYGDEIVVSALEACVRILSDETKSTVFWKL